MSVLCLLIKDRCVDSEREGGSKREGGKERERDKQRESRRRICVHVHVCLYLVCMCVCVCVHVCVCVCVCVSLCVHLRALEFRAKFYGLHIFFLSLSLKNRYDVESNLIFTMSKNN